MVAVDLDHGDVGLGVGSDHLGLEAALVLERHRDVLGVGDHVVVGEHVALAVDDEARARGRHDARVVAGQVTEEATEELVSLRVAALAAGAADLLLHVHEHHRGQGLLDHGDERALGNAAGSGHRGGRGGTLGDPGERGALHVQTGADAQAENDADQDQRDRGREIAPRVGEGVGTPAHGASVRAKDARRLARMATAGARGPAGQTFDSGYRVGRRSAVRNRSNSRIRLSDRGVRNDSVTNTP